MKTIDQLLETDKDSLLDMLAEFDFDFAVEDVFSVPYLKAIFMQLPEAIKNTAYCWGLDDTVFRDDAFTHLNEHQSILEHAIAITEDEHLTFVSNHRAKLVGDGHKS